MIKLIWALSMLLLFLAFQNCSMHSTHDQGSSVSVSSFKACDQESALIFLQGYYPRLRQACAGCHAEGGTGFGKFASVQAASAFQEFVNLGRVSVERNMLNTAHRFPSTEVPANKVIVDRYASEWLDVEARTAACRGLATMITTDKVTPATVFSTSPSNTAAWPKLEWNLETDLPGLNSPVRAFASIEIRRLRVNNQDVGFEFKNPRIRVADSNVPYGFKGMHIVVDGKTLNDVTTYALLDVVVNSVTDVLIAPSSAFANTVRPISSSNRLSLRFDAILDGSGLPVTPIGTPSPTPTPLPNRVTHTQLLSNDTTLGVFSRSCVGCHNVNNAAGGLNISNYANAAQASAASRARMNNAANPMPPSGLLSATDRAVVDVWISSGVPQN